MSSPTKARKRTSLKDKHSTKASATKSVDSKDRKVFLIAGIVVVAVLLLLYLLFRSS